MARFSGKVGYGIEQRTAPGVTEDVIIEKHYIGDVVRLSRQQRESTESVNNDISASHSISIVADPFAIENFLAIQYVIWAGVYWTVSEVEVQHPRLIMRLGEVYNGPKAGTADAPGTNPG
jgi:hypothetical protein